MTKGRQHKKPCRISQGKKLGVAGGPLDKSWLLLKALGLKNGVDLEERNHPVRGAAAIGAKRPLQGEIDAALEFWTFATDLEAKGFSGAPSTWLRWKRRLAQPGEPTSRAMCSARLSRRKTRPPWRDSSHDGRAPRSYRRPRTRRWRSPRPASGQKDKATLDLYRQRYAPGVPRPLRPEVGSRRGGALRCAGAASAAESWLAPPRRSTRA